MTNPALIEELKTLVEPGKVLTDADSLNTYGKDWTKHFAPAPLAIAFPKSIEQVQAIVRWANVHRIALVPSGGRTGLSAAAVAANGEVVVAFVVFTAVVVLELLVRYMPLWAILSLGVYALSSVIYRVSTLGDRPDAASELTTEISLAKEKLRAAGFCYLWKDIEISNIEEGRALNSWLIGLCF